jgi:hypothetical protein
MISSPPAVWVGQRGRPGNKATGFCTLNGCGLPLILEVNAWVSMAMSSEVHYFTLIRRLPTFVQMQ